MTTLRQLTSSCGLRKKDLDYWGALVADGFGYSRIEIPQRRRAPRKIVVPSVELDRVLKQVHLGLLIAHVYAPLSHVHGFVSGRGIMTNAKQHLDKDVVLRVDLADFFGGIDISRIEASLAAGGLTRRAAEAVARVTTIGGVLPLGFSTSPILSNLAFRDTDRALVELANNSNVVFTRYVDDLIFSGSTDDINDDLLESIRMQLEAFGWQINSKKTRFMRRGKSQFVTGLYVGDSQQPRVPKRMKRMLRREVYFAKQFGLKSARRRSPSPMRPERIDGWLRYLVSVEPSVGRRLLDEWRQVGWKRSASIGEGHDPKLEVLDRIGLPYGPVDPDDDSWD